MGTKMKMSLNLAPLKMLAAKSPELFRKAEEKAAIQFLNWANNGSKNTSKKPPIRWGVLRGSSSAFVGGKLVSIFKINVKEGKVTPAESHSAPNTTMTWVWNTSYAAKMHEHKGGWGKFTVQDGDAGNKWLEEHLQKDADDLMKMIAKEFKTLAGT